MIEVDLLGHLLGDFKIVRVPLSFRGFPAPTILAIATTVLMMTYLGASAWVLGALMLASGVGAWWVGPYFGRTPVLRGTL